MLPPPEICVKLVKDAVSPTHVDATAKSAIGVGKIDMFFIRLSTHPLLVVTNNFTEKVPVVSKL
ncbi:MAG: hypothetical protein BWY67_01349 [Bacteroidetes bacterium ADurb.Bin397]|nr:MAG: hypothetical protein BWY67_01349 [Bacteroidetes bacterium ADurb.Bin397]